ncbi:MAG: hypothetical protein ACHQHP_05950 [Bacteroidia bacterium]
MNTLLSIHWALVASIFYFGNGLLHDIFVLKAHKGEYNRDLLRLLMDGHVLMLSGAIMFVCWLMLMSKIQCAVPIAIIVAVFMLIYCAMIFPFLKSFGTIIISLIVIIVCLRAYSAFPSIWEVMGKYR